MIKEQIIQAGRSFKTIIIELKDKDIREVQPYGFRDEDGRECLFVFDLKKGKAHSFAVADIISVKITDNMFLPKWTIEL